MTSHIAHDPVEFQGIILSQLGFQRERAAKFGLRYRSPNQDGGYFHQYRRPGEYDLSIADYTIPSPFRIQFANPHSLIRFGTLSAGVTECKIKGRALSQFRPSSFFVFEDQLAGEQHWKELDHLHGVEISVTAAFFGQTLQRLTGEVFDFNLVQRNHTYNYLPVGMIEILQQLAELSRQGELNGIFLECKVLECLALLYEELHTRDKAGLLGQSSGSIRIGKDRLIHLSRHDTAAIQKAHGLLAETAANPPTVEALAALVGLSVQKLKAGFHARYAVTIRDFLTILRMSTAAKLLCTTDRPIRDIARVVGYQHCSNFIKMFRSHHQKTPLEYRRDTNDLRPK